MAPSDNPRVMNLIPRLTLAMVVPEVEADGFAGPDSLLKDNFASPSYVQAISPTHLADPRGLAEPGRLRSLTFPENPGPLLNGGRVASEERFCQVITQKSFVLKGFT